MLADQRVRFFGRWSIVAVMGLLGASLLVTAWTTYAAVQSASQTLVLGQLNTLHQSLRSQLLQLEERPTQADLAAILEEESEDGLRYLALLNAEGEVLLSAGSPVKEEGFPVALREGPVRVEDRIRMTFGVAPRRWEKARKEQPHFRRRAPPRMVVEVVPVEANVLRSAATRTLGIGGAAATVLFVLAAGLVRWVLRQETREREQERERRLASLGEMSAVLAHEIRNPLASLKGNAQLLAEGLPEGEKQRQKAERVVNEAVRLEALTNDLLDYVKSGALQKRPVSPATLLSECAPPGVDVDVQAAPASWTLDPERMRQVLLNLFENAVQAGAPVRSRVRTNGAILLFEIEDSGPGVPEADRERIFEPFFTRRIQGTGLGLAVSKRVVELHGGQVSVHTAPGDGALFRVALPEE